MLSSTLQQVHTIPVLIFHPNQDSGTSVSFISKVVIFHRHFRSDSYVLHLETNLKYSLMILGYRRSLKDQLHKY